MFVRPQLGRVVLMDQDVRHRINAPSQLAPQPRYSFVEKVRPSSLTNAAL